MFAHLGDDTSLWGAILEKAFAKYHGNYSRIEGGDPGRAVSTLNGGPFETINHQESSMQEIWTKLTHHHSEDDMIIAGTPGSND